MVRDYKYRRRLHLPFGWYHAGFPSRLSDPGSAPRAVSPRSLAPQVLTYVEYKAVSGVFQNIDPPPFQPASVSYPRTLAGRWGGWGVNILEDARHRIGLLQYNLSTPGTNKNDKISVHGFYFIGKIKATNGLFTNDLVKTTLFIVVTLNMQHKITVTVAKLWTFLEEWSKQGFGSGSALIWVTESGSRRAKITYKTRKSKEISCFEVLNDLFKCLKAFPVVCASFMEA